MDVNDQSANEYDVKNDEIRDDSEIIEEVNAENVDDNVSSNPNPPTLDLHDNTSSELKFKCNLCCLKYQGRKELRKHKEDIHYWCSYCFSSFKNKDELQKHKEDTHNMCSFCFLPFKNEDKLKNHITNQHTKI